MWLFDLVCISVGAGTVVGLLWFFGGQWFEQRNAKKAKEIEMLDLQDELDQANHLNN